MRIGIVCYPTHGGSGVVATELGHQLAELGHEVHFISYAMPFRFEAYRRNVTYHEVEVSAYPLFRYPPYDLALAGTIMEVREQFGLDILHAHYAIPHAISGILAREMLNHGGRSLRLVTTLHGTDITIIGQQRVYQRVTAFGIERSDAVTSVSEELRQRTVELLSCKNTPIEVIPNFVDTERFAPGCCAEKREMLALDDEKIILHASNFRSVKRPLDLVEAFAVANRRVKSRLVLVGDGPELASVKARADELGVRKRVTFVGTYDAIWELMPQADVFFLPSEYESFGLSALEAMSCGVPVVASRTGGLPEVVDHERNGFLTPVGDTRAQAEALCALLLDGDRRRAFGEAAREAAVSRFAVEKVLPRWVKVYEAALSNDSGRFKPAG
jgi:N-acetyl-alpha-D-glucosaminyl L-malate synthase BshA